MKSLLSCLLLLWGALSFWFWNNQRSICCDQSVVTGEVNPPKKDLEAVLPSLPLNDSESVSDTKQALEETSTSDALGNNTENSSPEVGIREPDADYVIYFKEGSSQWLNVDDVQAYVNILSRRVRKSKEKIIITGYDDNTATPDQSIKITDQRTWRVRKAFKDDYVRRMLVTMVSKGQENPIAPNDTPDGRSKNRRVELKIIKE